MPPPSSRIANKRGFALPAVLTVVTALTLVFLTAMLSLEGLRDEARSAVAFDTFHRDALSAEAHIAFIALTQPYGPRSIRIGGPLSDPFTGAPVPAAADGPTGFAEQQLLIDGTPYALLSGDEPPRTLVVSVQDEAGLVNLNYAGAQAVSAAFQRAGADPLLGDILADQLHDYISTTGARSLRGADSAEYERAGAAPPPARPLETWAQLYGLLALRSPNSVDLERLRTFATVGSYNSINVNTASPDALMTFFPISQGMANDMVESRQRQPISDLAALAIPVPPGETQQYYFPDGNLRLTFTDPTIFAVYRAEFQLSPRDLSRPFWIVDSELLRQPPKMRTRHDVSQLTKFPDISSPSAGG
jgi:hypothetical protein